MYTIIQARHRMDSYIANTLLNAPHWREHVHHALSAMLCLSAGLLAALFVVALYTTKMPLWERIELVLRPLKRFDASVILPLGLHLDARWLAQAVLSGIVLYGVPLAAMLLNQ